MTTLFDTDEPAAPAVPPPPARVGPAAVEELVAFGYDRAKVEAWTRARADTVLAKRRRDAQKDLNHAAANAARNERPAVPEPTAGELTLRLCAAEYLGQVLAERDPDGLLCALVYAMHPLRTEEMACFAALLKLQLQLHPLTGDPLAPPYPQRSEGA